jgi:hypothetical protein
MKTIGIGVRIALLLFVVGGVAGCGVGSVAPLVSERDARFDPLLVGAWQDSSSKESAVITVLGKDRYRIVYTDDKGNEGRFDGVLGPVGGQRILDVQPEVSAIGANDLYKSLLLRLHGAVFVEAIEPRLCFRILDADSLKNHLERHPGTIAHVINDDGIVLTAPTAEVRRFLAAYLRRPGALGGRNVWVRRAP